MQGGTDRVGDQVPAVDPDGPPRALFIAALLLAVLTVGAVLTVAAVRRTPTAPVVIAAVPAPAAEGPECAARFAALPDQLGDYRRAETAQPTPAATAAWRTDEAGTEPVIMRCGLDRPVEFVVGAPIQMVNEVQWFRIDSESSAPLFDQLRTAVIAAVRDGRLAAGTRLPTVRELAGELGLAVNTVARAYRELESAGIVETRGRRGTFIARCDPADAAMAAAAHSYAQTARGLGLGEQDAVRYLAAEFD